MEAHLAADAPAGEKFALSTSMDFVDWLSGTRSSIAFTTYQAGKLFLIAASEGPRPFVFERSFPRCMGLAVSADASNLALATQYQIQRFDNVLRREATRDRYDALYAPHAAWVTGDLDVHDVAFGTDGRPLFVNTLFSCIATVSDGHSFKPLWKPSFISGLAAEDRCHLNGLAAADGSPRFVTAVSRSDVPDGWRDGRVGGGIVIDVEANEIIVEGLSMPHSPRLHDGKLWLLNSGVGQLGFADLETGKFEPVAFCPGYARGLAFVDDHAIVGLSLARDDDRTFSGLPLDAALQAHGSEAQCGLAVFDLKTGEMSHWLRIEGVVRELYDVAMLPDVRRPSLIGFKADDVRRVISIEE